MLEVTKTFDREKELLRADLNSMIKLELGLREKRRQEEIERERRLKEELLEK